MLASTRSRVPAEQIWPVFSVKPAAIVAAAASRSASAKTTCGDLPPSSSVTGTSRSAAARATARPVATEPVKPIRRTRRSSTSAAPASAPVPVTTLSRPAGSPAPVATRASSSVVVEVNSEGLITTALPTASAGAAPRAPWLAA